MGLGRASWVLIVMTVKEAREQKTYTLARSADIWLGKLDFCLGNRGKEAGVRSNVATVPDRPHGVC